MTKLKKGETRIKKPFKTSGIFLLVIALLILLSPILKNRFISSASSIIIFTGIIFVFIGFYALGKKYKNEFLAKTIIVGFIFFIALFIFASYSTINHRDKFLELNETFSIRESNLQQLKSENVSKEIIDSYEKETLDYLSREALPLLIPFLIIYFIYACYSTFFGIAILKLKNVKYSKIIGIFNILSVWLVFTIIGIFLAIPLAIVSYILTTLTFFNESKKAKE